MINLHQTIQNLQSHFSIPDISLKCRKREIVFPRQVCCYIWSFHNRKSRQHPEYISSGKVAQMLKISHSTVLLSVDVIKGLMEVNKAIQAQIIEILEVCESKGCFERVAVLDGEEEICL